MPFCTLNAAFAVASATFVGGAVVAARSGADAESALGRWRRARDAKIAAEEVRRGVCARPRAQTLEGTRADARGVRGDLGRATRDGGRRETRDWITREETDRRRERARTTGGEEREQKG